MGALLLFLLGICAFPGVVIALTPARFVKAAAGWIIFFVGLVFIDYKSSSVAPFDDDGAFPDPSSFLLTGWTMATVIAIAVRREALVESLSDSRYRAFLNWTVPIGALLGVGFSHWLRNRLAGAEPAAEIHVVVASGFLLVLGVTHRLRRFENLRETAMAFAITGLLLVAANIQMGFSIARKAETLAAGRPFCLMTYGGWETRRRAQNGWDLSPLVNRHYGVWAVRKTPFLTIKEGDALASYRYFWSKWDNVTDYRRHEHRLAPCVPGKP